MSQPVRLFKVLVVLVLLMQLEPMLGQVDTSHLIKSCADNDFCPKCVSLFKSWKHRVYGTSEYIWGHGREGWCVSSCSPQCVSNNGCPTIDFDGGDGWVTVADFESHFLHSTNLNGGLIQVSPSYEVDNADNPGTVVAWRVLVNGNIIDEREDMHTERFQLLSDEIFGSQFNVFVDLPTYSNGPGEKDHIQIKVRVTQGNDLVKLYGMYVTYFTFPNYVHASRHPLGPRTIQGLTSVCDSVTVTGLDDHLMVLHHADFDLNETDFLNAITLRFELRDFAPGGTWQFSPSYRINPYASEGMDLNIGYVFEQTPGSSYQLKACYTNPGGGTEVHLKNRETILLGFSPGDVLLWKSTGGPQTVSSSNGWKKIATSSNTPPAGGDSEIWTLANVEVGSYTTGANLATKYWQVISHLPRNAAGTNLYGYSWPGNPGSEQGQFRKQTIGNSSYPFHRSVRTNLTDGGIVIPAGTSQVEANIMFKVLTAGKSISLERADLFMIVFNQELFQPNQQPDFCSP